MKKTDFLTFTISKKKARYNKNQIIYNVSLKINEFKKYYTEIKSKIREIEEEDLKCQKIASLLRGNIKKINQEKVSRTLDELTFSLNNIRLIANQSILVEDKYSSFEYEWIEFHSWLQNRDNDYKGLYDKIDHLLCTLHNNVTRTIRMFEVLKDLGDKYLQVLVTFGKTDIELHFIRYALNEESFSEVIKEILMDEFNDKYMKKYRVIENTFFQIYDNLWSNNVETFLESCCTLFIVDKKMKEFDSVFLDEQKRFDEMDAIRIELIHYLQKAEFIFEEIHKVIESKFANNHSDLFIKTLYVINEMDIMMFKSIEVEKLAKTIDFLEKRIVKMEGYPKIITLGTLNLIDRKSAALQRRHVYKMKETDEYSLIDYNKGFLLKKAKKGLFDNKFYSHIVSIFKFLSDDSFQKNRYTSVQGFDKRFDQKNIIPVLGSYKLKGKSIKYMSILEIEDYYINLSMDN